MTEETPKQWIVMRTDLKMRKGKMIAQGAHASMKVLLDRQFDRMLPHDPGWRKEGTALHRDDSYTTWRITADPAMHAWLQGLFTKICVRVESEEQLETVYEKAKEAGLPCALIVDAGKTEFNGVPTKTCCAIGPAYPSQVKDIVGDLKLL